MSSRLDKEREKRLSPLRFQTAIRELRKIKCEDDFKGHFPTRIDIKHNGHTIQFFPYSGWHTGKGIKDGRGLKNLLKQLSNE